MLQSLTACLVATIGFDTAENEPSRVTCQGGTPRTDSAHPPSRPGARARRAASAGPPVEPRPVRSALGSYTHASTAILGQVFFTLCVFHCFPIFPALFRFRNLSLQHLIVTWTNGFEFLDSSKACCNVFILF